MKKLRPCLVLVRHPSGHANQWWATLRWREEGMNEGVPEAFGDCLLDTHAYKTLTEVKWWARKYARGLGMRVARWEVQPE